MENYDNGLTRFKKELWSICTSMKVFDNIPEEQFEKVKQIFENSISNHQNQILQQQGEGNDGLIKQTLVGEINKEVQSLKKVTRDSLQQDKKSKFDAQLQEKQNVYQMHCICIILNSLSSNHVVNKLHSIPIALALDS